MAAVILYNYFRNILWAEFRDSAVIELKPMRTIPISASMTQWIFLRFSDKGIVMSAIDGPRVDNDACKTKTT
jgi:hypothetical protein